MKPSTNKIQQSSIQTRYKKVNHEAQRAKQIIRQTQELKSKRKKKNIRTMHHQLSYVVCCSSPPPADHHTGP